LAAAGAHLTAFSPTGARCSGQMLDSWFVSSPLVKNIGSSKLKAMMGDDTQQIGVIGAGINA
jgi:hypothetical protein